MPAPVRYRVWFRNPHDHLVRVELQFVAPSDDPVVRMPSWTPGSYLLREFGRHVQTIGSRVDGTVRPVEKIAKSSWRVSASAGASVTIAYSLYAHDLTVRTPHVDGTHAFLIGTGVFLWVDGLEEEAVEVAVEPPKSWQVFTTLERDEGAVHTYRADNYEHLADTLLELGAGHDLLEFEVLGVPHRAVFWGRGNYDAERLVVDMARVVETNAALFGRALPYDRYLFIVHLTDDGQGGLEHRDCAALQWPRHKLRERDYDDFLRLVTHEHLHVWNVKRIRPEALGPFDYSTENHTRALWAMEGVTSYYDQRQLLVAGLLRPQRYLKLTAKRIGQLEAVPGRRLRSLEAASFEAWHVLYKPTEQTPNASVSYYLLGSLVTLVLDLEIRRATSGTQTFDDVMRALWRRYLEQPDHGFPDDDFKRVVVEVGGEPLERWIRAYIEGTEGIDWPHHLDVVGLSLERGDVGQAPYLGVIRREDGDRLYVATVLSDGPNAGLNLYPGDEIAAINGFQVTAANWSQVLRLLPLEGEVELALFRRGELVLAKGRVSPRRGRPTIVPAPEASAEQKRLRREWLGGELPE